MFTSPWHGEPAARPNLPMPGSFLLASSGKPPALTDQLPVYPPPSLASPISPQVQLVSTGFPLARNGQSSSACWEERKPDGGEIIQMSSWLELLKATSLLLLSLHTPPQRGHTPREGKEMFGVV